MTAEWGAVLAVALMVVVNVGSMAFFLGGLRSDVRSLDRRVERVENEIFHS
jgi:sensor domain CHASE-containing protein